MNQKDSYNPQPQNMTSHFGWEIPRCYLDPRTEFIAAQTGAVALNSSYVGRLKATGPDALDLINRMSTNQVLNLSHGRCAHTILTTDRGRILDLIHVVNTDESILILTSPGEHLNVINWLDKYTIMEEITFEDVTTSTRMITLLGPNCILNLDRLIGSNLQSLESYSTQLVNISNEIVRIIKKPLGDIQTVDLIIEPQQLDKIWNTLLNSGTFLPMGMDAYESFRVEHAIPGHSSEMGESYNPLETGLIGSIDFHKGCYIGQEVIARLDSYKKIQKHLVTLIIRGDHEIPPGADLTCDGQYAGKVTSVALNPSTNMLVGLGYINTAQALIGKRLDLDGYDSDTAEITGLPQLFGAGE